MGPRFPSAAQLGAAACRGRLPREERRRPVSARVRGVGGGVCVEGSALLAGFLAFSLS